MGEDKQSWLAGGGCKAMCARWTRPAAGAVGTVSRCNRRCGWTHRLLIIQAALDMLSGQNCESPVIVTVDKQTRYSFVV